MARPQRQGNNPGIPFDPLQYMKRLEAVGFTREQAEAQAETFLTIVQEQLITKQDLKEVEAQLTSQIKELESKTTLEFESIRRDIKESEMNARNQSELLRRDLKIWFGGMLVTLVIVLSTVQTVIAHFASH
jgi:hypothetical protein